MRDLLTEYADLFPGQWFHLGGDEYSDYLWEWPAEAVGDSPDGS
ncbi:family 20 glycosylhydrolase [Streptomyces sp. NPDC002795]